MKVTEHISKAKDTLFSFEILPPKKGETIDNLFQHIDQLMEFNPPFIDVTYHREEFDYREQSNGMLKKVKTRKRPGTVGICSAIQNRYQVDTVPHLICGGFTQEDIENILVDLDFLGIDNVLALRGDPIKSESGFVPVPGGHRYASDLLQQVNQLNQGKWLDDSIKDPHQTDFCIGVSGYPEKHFEAPNFEVDFQHLKKKVEMGAEFVVTQMFFDNQAFFRFVDRCRSEGINVPIIPGLKPITTLRHMTVLPKTFFLDLPQDLCDALHQCKSNADAREVGIEWCIQQCRELKEFGVPVLHFYTMSRSAAVKKVAEALF